MQFKNLAEEMTEKDLKEVLDANSASSDHRFR